MKGGFLPPFFFGRLVVDGWSPVGYGILEATLMNSPKAISWYFTKVLINITLFVTCSLYWGGALLLAIFVFNDLPEYCADPHHVNEFIDHDWAVSIAHEWPVLCWVAQFSYAKGPVIFSIWLGGVVAVFQYIVQVGDIGFQGGPLTRWVLSLPLIPLSIFSRWALSLPGTPLSIWPRTAQWCADTETFLKQDDALLVPWPWPISLIIQSLDSSFNRLVHHLNRWVDNNRALLEQMEEQETMEEKREVGFVLGEELEPDLGYDEGDGAKKEEH